MPAIEVSALTKRFGEVRAVEDLSFTVEEGEVFGFLGPNGAGKSTAINVLLGYMSPTSGGAKVLGHDVVEASRAIRERTGVLPENVSVYDRLTGREHVESAIRMKGVDDDPQALLERVGIADAADRRAGGYSTGMAQRLALATALVGEPDLLVLDEPQSGLDPTGMQDVREIVREEVRNDTTVFFSSHILPEVEAVSDRVGMMRRGEMAAVDTVGSLRDRLSAGTVLTATMADPLPDTRTIDAIDGVRAVSTDGATVTVTCRTDRSKVDVINALERVGRITDFTIEETSLEELFNIVTGEQTEETADATDETVQPATADGGVAR
ncbi:ATP-binding cassette domain-containing protein [Halomicrobium sp. HM KBTZ05]|uniref:ABC transporter ATP-binding protein n=1 Tax=Halomicrobium sp. HM KBTZ05 TaxID=3242663 RepID=UPI003555D590